MPAPFSARVRHFFVGRASLPEKPCGFPVGAPRSDFDQLEPFVSAEVGFALPAPLPAPFGARVRHFI
eukprot:9795127-Alexandrium_andersonii.AAC.1